MGSANRYTYIFRTCVLRRYGLVLAFPYLHFPPLQIHTYVCSTCIFHPAGIAQFHTSHFHTCVFQYLHFQRPLYVASCESVNYSLPKTALVCDYCVKRYNFDPFNSIISHSVDVAFRHTVVCANFSHGRITVDNTDDLPLDLTCIVHEAAQLMLTNPRDAFRGQPRSPNIPFHIC